MQLSSKLLLIVPICEMLLPSNSQTMKNVTYSNNRMTELQKALIKILKDCKKDYSTVLTFLDSVEMNFKWFQELQTGISMITHQNLSVPIKEYSCMKKIDAYIIIVQSWKSVYNVYHYLTNLFSWADVLMPVYVLTTEMCEKSYFSEKNKQNVEMLDVFFDMMKYYKIVTPYLICHDNNNGIKLYTYNLFTDRAPQQWMRIEEKYINQSTMYEQNFREDEICDELDFDRTKQLDGFELIFDARYFSLQSISHISAITTALNVRCVIYAHDFQIDTRKRYPSQCILTTRLSSTFDVFMNAFTMERVDAFKDYKASYPMLDSELGIVTYHKGYQTFAEKIRDFYGTWIILFTVFIILATSIVIWFSKKKLVFAIFEIIRLLIGQSLQTRMNTFSLRIFFSMIFIYFIVIQSTFNGHLAKFLTKPQLREHADTLQDLQELGYTKVYDSQATNMHLAQTFDERNSTNNLANTCVKYMLNNDTSAACIFPYRMLYHVFSSDAKKLYLSERKFGSHYSQYLIYQGSPLRDRIYTLLLLFGDLGIDSFMRNRRNSEILVSKMKTMTTSNGDFRPIQIEDLVFIFILLAVGLSCAVCTFCIEMCIYYFKKNRRKYEN